MSMSTATRIPHVAVWVEGSRSYSRGLIRGVAHYVREHGPWSIYFTRHGLLDPLPAWLRNWNGDGILAQIHDWEMVKFLSARNLPLVDLRGRIKGPGLPFFGLDNQRVAQLAFEHLRERGFRHYAFCGLPLDDHVHMAKRGESFCELVSGAGFECLRYQPPRPRGRTSHDWEHEQDRLGKWLLSLPKPIGIMTSGDDRGHDVVDACRRVSLAVPDQVAVVGVDNDEEMCNLCTPALTSVEVDSQRIGYAAAACLARAMATKTALPADEQLFAPTHVVTRLSTDIMAVDDPMLARALRFIRDHACEGISVDDVTRAAATSRRGLEQSIQAALGRTPNQEILRVRIRRIQDLLLETDLPLEAIARSTAFRSQGYLSDVFLRETGQRPAEYRRRARAVPRLPDWP